MPVATDALNWRWPTLSAVMAGRSPAHKLEAVREGENPVDLSLSNNGEADESPGCDVVGRVERRRGARGLGCAPGLDVAHGAGEGGFLAGARGT